MLSEVIKALLTVETKGQSTLVMADCIRALAQIEAEQKKEEEKDETVHDS